ncbi:class I SAM-dependent methyltransferase [Sedimenticola selenatireducens]|uniref:Methyltransferase domain-containing protein n=1 Tax=Sedimenticola selenatireducens TaxID=191960 RepID=A0A558DUG1_9GAMM|nr:class I SAM-dependent methyltransferase [Sedimenticola selenatireducens]TVO72432.1 methyltransferase domain-containing protein [Sedimenticola selenatireducens]TVT64687.1 MAG: methyltransferase domain-containing protein [Sedimenticola selenatireducens]
MSKSPTDIHWNKRAVYEQNVNAVNIADVSQRELETEFILQHVKITDRVLEVGCGNGFLTNILRLSSAHVDAFDYAENMIVSAKENYGETNNRFFHDNLLSPASWDESYDCIVCVRVLINLRDFSEQKRAVENMQKALRKGGKLLLVEGYADGFTELNKLRSKSGIEPLIPAGINYYSKLEEMREFLGKRFTIAEDFHTGCFDFLTRVVYPALVGADKATGHSDFHEKIIQIAKNFNGEQFRTLARLTGFLLVNNKS